MAFLAVQKVFWGEERVVGTWMVGVECRFFVRRLFFLAEVTRSSL
jgi:hypothetical protein